MKKITLVLKGYPRLSETFIAQEILELEKRGMDITLVSLRHPTDKTTHPVHQQIKAKVIYLPEYLYQETIRVFKAWLTVRNKPTYKTAVKKWWKDFKRDRSFNRIRRFGQALVLAKEMPDKTDLLYAHFLHTPASVTRYASIISAIPWSCSAHAKDIWTSPKWELSEKLQELEWLATCTRSNHQYLSSLANKPEKVNLVYHGLDLKRFSPPDELTYNSFDGSSAEHPVKLISVGRAVAKKGYDILLKALGEIPVTSHWQLDHIGDGPLLQKLKAQAEQAGISQHINWLGALPQKKVLELYRQSDIFVLASKIVADGDRDGLPNVLMEAQSQGVCCLATNISGIPELLENDTNGIMVEAENIQQLSTQLQRLITHPELRKKLGQAGLKKMQSRFNVNLGIDQLITLFEQ